MLGKNRLPDQLVTARTLVRRATAADLAQIAAWPNYPWPYESLSMTSTVPRPATNPYWWQRLDEPERCQYSVVVAGTREVIGVHALVQIDWERAVVGNTGVRIRNDVRGRGLGSETLGPLLKAVLASGMACIRLDVAATNPQAIRCYEKSGMDIVEEFWREGLGPADPGEPRWAPLMPHLRREGNRWLVRFYWMEIRRAATR